MEEIVAALLNDDNDTAERLLRSYVIKTADNILNDKREQQNLITQVMAESMKAKYDTQLHRN